MSFGIKTQPFHQSDAIVLDQDPTKKSSWNGRQIALLVGACALLAGGAALSVLTMNPMPFLGTLFLVAGISSSVIFSGAVNSDSRSSSSSLNEIDPPRLEWRGRSDSRSSSSSLNEIDPPRFDWRGRSDCLHGEQDIDVSIASYTPPQVEVEKGEALLKDLANESLERSEIRNLAYYLKERYGIEGKVLERIQKILHQKKEISSFSNQAKKGVISPFGYWTKIIEILMQQELSKEDATKMVPRLVQLQPERIEMLQSKIIEMLQSKIIEILTKQGLSEKDATNIAYSKSVLTRLAFAFAAPTDREEGDKNFYSNLVKNQV